ncbi:MAG: hypothetical protein HQ515_21925 [Phycisphaeraceae bacterium]|nr:hypothetical protein [Phycisphaeraceae bacterium]
MLDLNGDGPVDIEDLQILIGHWGQNEPSVDIAPAPLGDGVVDANDLQVLMRHWGQDATFVAHWKLDETGGDIVYDSIAENDAVVKGNALWQRESGQVDGALQLDGINDYVKTPYVLNPSESAFSVFVWVKGGESGQSILSQEEGAHWLLTDAQGCVGSALVGIGGRGAGGPLMSETVVTDGLWHRIGFVWDRSYRSLYVDDELVATDVIEQLNFPDRQGGLFIGAGKDRESDTLWSGLIDDVRIYDRAVISQ